jgi:hypothetical protein
MRNRLIRSTLTTGIFLSLAAVAGCSGHSDTYVTRAVVVDAPVYGPPPPQAEMVIVRPGPGYAWVGGYYDYYRGRYYWRRGYWGRPPYPGQHFYPPRYVPRHGGGYMTIQGGWR